MILQKDNIKKWIHRIPLFIAIILFIYLMLCYIVVDFAFSIFIAFVGMIIINILLWYTLEHPIDKDDREPSFIYVFIKVAYVAVMGSMCIMILSNVLSKKYYLPPKERYHYMIVFGAGINNDVVNKRIEKAIECAKKDNNIKFVLSGSQMGDDLYVEATYMKDYMLNSGVKEDKILLDIFANNTYENISNSLYIIQQDILKRNRYESFLTRPFDTKNDEFDLGLINIGFISSDFHMWRVNMMAKKKGIKKPYDVPVVTNSFLNLYYYIRENLSVFKAYVLGQLKAV